MALFSVVMSLGWKVAASANRFYPIGPTGAKEHAYRLIDLLFEIEAYAGAVPVGVA